MSQEVFQGLDYLISVVASRPLFLGVRTRYAGIFMQHKAIQMESIATLLLGRGNGNE